MTKTDAESNRTSVRADGFLPIRTLAVELTGELPTIEASNPETGVHYGSALVLVRYCSEPVGIVTVAVPPHGLKPDLLAAAIWNDLKDLIRPLLSFSGPELDALSPDELLQHAQASSELKKSSPLEAPITAVICTRERPDQLRECLTALSRQDHPNYEVVVVDNAPTTDATTSVVNQMSHRLPVRRVVEPRPGLARARNVGLREATSGLIAFLDDDELPDEHWLSELSAGFQVAGDVGCVTGMILPASLETPAQVWFDKYADHTKSRGLTQAVFDPSSRSSQHPLYPLPPFGAGGNMAFRREAITAVGGFDPALGAGTPTKAAEDTAAFADVMLEGYRLVYRPAALVWHQHYQEFADLHRQLYGYGSGLTTYFVRLILRRPHLIGQLLALAPRGIRDLAARDSRRAASIQAGFPAELRASHRRGLLWGLVAYPIALWQQRGTHRQLSDVA